MQFDPFFIHANCPACHAEAIRQIHQIRDLPGIMYPVDWPTRNRVLSHDLIIAKCDRCSHVFSPRVSLPLNRIIYEDYYRFYPFEHLETMKRPYRERFEWLFLSLQANVPGPLLEIGCDSRDQLEFFVNRGFKCSGIAPRAKPEPDVTFYAGYYEDTPLPGQYAVVVSRFNLEHVIDPKRFLAKVARDLAPNGRAYFQVPNAQFYFKADCLNIYAHEHIHYFSASSLRAMLETHGFEVEVLTGRDEPSLLAACRIPDPAYDPGRSTAQAQAAMESVRELLPCQRDRQLVFYGCGLPLTAILYCSAPPVALPPDVVLFDDNPVVTRRFMPNTDLVVQPFDPLKVKPGAIVILTTSRMYHSAMRAKIPAERGCRVYALEQDGLHELPGSPAK
jgi:SAM-dependent methyltransferase